MPILLSVIVYFYLLVFSAIAVCCGSVCAVRYDGRLYCHCFDVLDVFD